MLNLLEIVDLQKKLDDSIHNKHQKTYEETFRHRKLALLVELGELANEVRSFKYWSIKPASPNEVILEEFVDCLHFTVSLGIGMDIKFNELQISERQTDDINLLFIETIDSVVKLDSINNKTYYTMFDYIFSLAKELGFNSNEIFDSYINKNKINHKRQENSY
ncbi:MAG: dUTP diphosphatase [Bacilli bacterium]